MTDDVLRRPDGSAAHSIPRLAGTREPRGSYVTQATFGRFVEKVDRSLSSVDEAFGNVDRTLQGFVDLINEVRGDLVEFSADLMTMQRVLVLAGLLTPEQWNIVRAGVVADLKAAGEAAAKNAALEEAAERAMDGKTREADDGEAGPAGSEGN